jgi:hypothetical protein
MWLYLILGALVVLAIAGGTVLGGIFTIVLVPIAGIVLVSAVVYAMWGRAQQGSAGGSTEASDSTDRPLPHRQPTRSGRAPTSPEALADARRGQQ